MNDAAPDAPRADLFARVAIATIAAVYLLIAAGGLVRVTGAGLGCPDWPRCFGRWVPPIDAAQLPPEYDATRFNVRQTWTEYLNRLLGVVVGLLITATLGLAVALRRGSPRVVRPAAAAFLLTGVQGWLGGQVVALELASWIVTVHLLLALLILALLLYSAASATLPPPDADPARRRLARLAMVVVALVICQVLLGAQVRGAIDAAIAGAPDLPRDVWIAEAGAFDLPHRQLGLLTWAGVLYLCRRTRSAAPGRARLTRSATSAAVIATVQLTAGVGLAYLGMPAALQLVHILGASLLFGSLVWTALAATRAPDERLRTSAAVGAA
jgi:cytochrome c oxidase assembly protein subunit 15